MGVIDYVREGEGGESEVLVFFFQAEDGIRDRFT